MCIAVAAQTVAHVNGCVDKAEKEEEEEEDGWCLSFWPQSMNVGRWTLGVF
jgi:hypothetical protein